jgi:hypothetical protein
MQFIIFSATFSSMKLVKLLRDIAIALALGLVLYVIGFRFGPSINEWVAKIQNPLWLYGLCAVVGILLTPSWVMTLRRWVRAVTSLKYATSPSLNIFAGVLVLFVLTQQFPASGAFAVIEKLVWLPLVLTSLTLLICFLLNLPWRARVTASTPPVDPLGRAKFIDKLLNLLGQPALLSAAEGEALIVWITSRWGTGKSWVLAETKRRFLEKNQSDKVIWFSFTPWLHSSAHPQEGLVEAFFSELVAEVNKRYFVERFSKVVNKYINAIIAKGSEKILGFELGVTGSMTAEDLRDKISAFLAENKLKLIITFDEVDRLSPEELATCLRLIRSLANFSNTTMLVCGAVEKIEDLLEVAQLPRDYLEKIAQVPLSLPRVDTVELLDILWDKIGAEALPEKVREGMREALLHYFPTLRITRMTHFGPLLENLRTIHRMADIILLDYLPRAEDLDFYDFLGLQLIKLNSLSLYELIQNNKPIWSGSKIRTMGNEREAIAETKKLFEELTKDTFSKISSPKRALLIEILENLFPTYKLAFASSSYVHGGNSFRLYNEEFFDRYFVEGLPKNQTSVPEIRELVNVWNAGGDIQASLAGRDFENIKWVFKQILTNQPYGLTPAGSKHFAKFLVDENLETPNKYQLGWMGRGLRASDVSLSNGEDMLEVLDYHLQKGTGLDKAFYDGSFYVNALWLGSTRREREDIKEADLRVLTARVIKEFKKRFINRGRSFFSLPPSEFHYYWKVLTRWDAGLDVVFRNSIKDRIQASAEDFVNYLYVYREWPTDRPKDGFSNNYDAGELGFTAENLALAKVHLQKRDLSEEVRKNLEDFIRLAEPRVQGTPHNE